MSWKHNTLLSAIGILCVLCCAAKQHPPAIESTLKYEYPDYSCEAQEATAVLSVVASEKVKRKPVLSVTSVMDVSGSVDGDASLEHQKRMNNFLVDALQKDSLPHKFGSVVFRDVASEWTALETLSPEIATQVQEKINATKAEGYTNLLEGIKKGLQQQMEDVSTNQHYVRALFVFSDGEPTAGVYDFEEIVAEVRVMVDAHDTPIQIYTFGLGVDEDLTLLEDIAEVGDGIAYGVFEEKDMPRAIGSALGGLLSAVALQMEYKIIPKEDVRIDHICGDLTELTAGEEVLLNIGDLSLGERRDTVITLTLPECTTNGSTATTEHPISIVEAYADAATRHRVSRQVPSKAVLRFPLLQTKRKVVTPVCVQKARCIIVQWLGVAHRQLVDGDVAAYAKAMQTMETETAMNECARDKCIEAMLQDARTVRSELDLSRGDTTEAAAELKGVIDAGKKQKTGLTNAEKFHSLECATTAAREKEIVAAANNMQLANSPFELKVNQGVGLVEEKGDYREINVTVSIHASEHQTDRPPLSLTTVLDISGSMDGATVQILIETHKKLIDWLLTKSTKQIYLGIVTFSNKVEELLGLTRLSEIDVDALKAKLDAIVAEGVTELGPALELGVKQQIANSTHAGSRAVFLLTDGFPSSGRDAITRDLASLLGTAPHPIAVSTFGLGQFDSDLLRDIADIGHGGRYILSNETDIPYSFGDALGGLLGMAAKDVEIEIRLASSSVQIANVFPETRIRKDGGVQVPFFDVYRGERKDVLLTLRVPKDVDVRELLHADISYTNVITGGKARKTDFRIGGTRPSVSPNKRSLDEQAVEMLERAINHCLVGSDIAVLMDVLTEAIKVVAESTHAGGIYTTDLEADLSSIRITLMDLRAGKTTRENCRLKMEALKDLLLTQRAKKTGKRTFRLEEHYDTKSKKENRISLAKGVSLSPEVPAGDAFSESYTTAPAEITTASQNVTVDVSLQGILQADVQPPSCVVFLIEVTTSTEDVILELMRSMVIRTWEMHSRSAKSQNSSLCVITYGDRVTIPLSLTKFSDATLEEIEAVFDQIVRGGEGVFKDAMVAALGVLQGVQERRDLMILPLIGRSLSTSQSVVDAKIFTAAVGSLRSPLTFTPVLLKESLTVDYFRAFPPWVQSGVVKAKNGEDVSVLFTKVRAVFQKAARHVRVKIIPDLNVTLLGVSEGVVYVDGSYSISDLSYGKTTTVPLQLSVPEHQAKQILFGAVFTYIDARCLCERERQSRPFRITRVESNTLVKRVEIRDKIMVYLREVYSAIEHGDVDLALSLTTRSVAEVIKYESTDSVVVEIHQRLTHVAQKIYDLINADVSDVVVLRSIGALINKLNVRAVVVAETVKAETVVPSVVPKPIVPRKILSSIPTPPVEKLKLESLRVVAVPVTDLLLPFSFSIEAPPRSGRMIDAHATIFIDSPADPASSLTYRLLNDLLSSLGGRCSKRSVRILTSNTKIVYAYENDDFSQGDVQQALGTVQYAVSAAKVDPSAVLREALKASQRTNSTVQVLYWIVTRDFGITESSKRRMNTALTTLVDGASPLTVFPFVSGIGNESSQLLQTVVQQSGGEFYPLDLDSTDASQEERNNRIADVARKAVAWIGDTFSKNIAIQFSLRGTVTLKNLVVGDANVSLAGNIVRLPTVRYGSKVTFSADAELGSSPGRMVEAPPQTVDNRHSNVRYIKELLEFSGEYYNVRSQAQEKFEPVSFTVEPLQPKMFNRLLQLNDALDAAAMLMMKEFGRNRLDAVLTSVIQSRVLIQQSGTENYSPLRHAVQLYENIQHQLKQYAASTDDVSPLQSATEMIGDLKPDGQYVSDNNTFLVSHPGILVATTKQTTFNPVITLHVPEVPDLSSMARHLIITAVFDTSGYMSLAERKNKQLSDQVKLVSLAINHLVTDEGFIVTLTATGNTDAEEVVLPSIRLNQSTLQSLDGYLSNIGETQHPGTLLSGLKKGLVSLKSQSESSERVLMLFSAPFSLCQAEDPQYADVFAPYTTHPINPVKVFTYIMGPGEDGQRDPISDLTGGARHFITDSVDRFKAVADMVRRCRDSAVRGLRLEITRPNWMERNLDSIKGGTFIKSSPKVIVALPDMEAGASHSVQLQLTLDKWTADVDLFEYTLSYFRTDAERWYRTRPIVQRLMKTSNGVVGDIHLMNQTMVQALDRAAEEVRYQKAEDALRTLQAALSVFDQYKCQDDSLISQFVIRLSNAYEDVLRLARETKPAEVPVPKTPLDANRILISSDLEQENMTEQAGVVDAVTYFVVGCSVVVGIRMLMWQRQRGGLL